MGRVQSFLSHYETEGTKRGYLGHVRKFLDFIYPDSTDLEQKAESYFVQRRDYLKDVEGFLVSTGQEAPMTRRMRLSTVKLFLIDNDVELGERNWKTLSRRIRGKRAITLDKVPTTEELRRIVQHLQINGKALVLTLASSGMRVGETLQLKLSDIDLTCDPPVVSLRSDYTKTGESRWAFISAEAKEAVEAWLRVRAPYIRSAAGKSHIYRKEVDGEDRLFPYAVTTAERVWRGAIRKAGLDSMDARTHRYQIHLHVLRKFFRTKVGAVIPQDVAEALIGHEWGLTEVYRRYSLEDLKGFYRKGEPAVTIFSDQVQMNQLREEIGKKNDQYSGLLSGVVSENLDLKTKLQKTQADLDSLAKRTAELEFKIGVKEELDKRAKLYELDEKAGTIQELLARRSKSEHG